MDLHVLLWHCFRHFAHLDESNAATHTASVRYSPITFRLAEHLAPLLDSVSFIPPDPNLLQNVLSHLATYAEDVGR